jgi:retron-type reverse transcriptase
MEEGIYLETDKGTLQGGILSPLLANISIKVHLISCADCYFEKRTV